MTPDEFTALAASKALELAQWMFPEGRREKADWLVPPVDEDGHPLPDGAPVLAINLGIKASTAKDLVSGGALTIEEVYAREFSVDATTARQALTRKLAELTGETVVQTSTNGAKPPAPAPEEEADLVAAREQRRPSAAPERQRMLPASDIAERGVVCSFLLAPKEVGAMCRARAVLPGSFHNPALGTMHRVLMDLWDTNQPIDNVTLTQTLHDRGLLEQIGGASQVAELFTYLPTATNVKYYLDILEEKKAARDLITIATEFAARGYDLTPADDLRELITDFQEKAASLSFKRGRDRLPPMDSLAAWDEEGNLPPEPPMLLQGMLHQGSKFILAAPSKGRKSWALLDMAASVASGQPWWGIPTVPGRVAYLNFELQRFAIARRLRSICKARRIPMTDQLQVMTLRGITTPIEQLADELINYFLHGPPYALIAVDPVFKLMAGRDENKVGDVMVILQNLEKIAVRTGAAIAIAHHYSKGNQAAKESIDRMGGSGAFARDPDAILMMTTHETEECFTVEPTLRNCAPMPPFVMRWTFPVFERAPDLHPDDLKQPPKKGARANDSVETAKTKLGGMFANRKILSFTEIVMQAGHTASRAGVKKWIKELAEAGLIEQLTVPKRGYQATERWEGMS